MQRDANQNFEGDPSMIRDVPSENYIKQWGLEHLTQLWVYFRALGAKNQKQTNGSERKFKVHPITLELFGLPPWADVEKVAVLDNRGLHLLGGLCGIQFLWCLTLFNQQEGQIATAIEIRRSEL